MAWWRTEEGDCFCGQAAEFEHEIFAQRLCQPDTKKALVEGTLLHTTTGPIVVKRCAEHAPRAVETYRVRER